ncbi:hypothetical protein, partial [Streptococcus pneumoniae]|uniref:hypothetical protein n=1 Tax=Streptococcus pneumoniae TaxID=1313 RepID=UPI0018B0D34D
IGDYKTARIYKVFAKDFSLSDVYVIEQFADKKYKLACITWDGKNIWACPEETGKIYSISFKNLKPIKF